MGIEEGHRTKSVDNGNTRDRSRSPTHHHSNRSVSCRREEWDGSKEDVWGKAEKRDIEKKDAEEGVEAPEPDFGLSGALAAETNTTVNGVVLKYNEPPEAGVSSVKWRLYCFKNGNPVGDPLRIYRKSSFLFGRDRRVADIPTDHPSCSLQHAVLQYRLTQKAEKDLEPVVRPYIIDLGSTNGTFVNHERVESERYYELLEKDVLQFGNSTREYVLLRE